MCHRPSFTFYILHLTWYLPQHREPLPALTFYVLQLADMLRTNTTLASIRCDAMPCRFAMQLCHAVANTLVAADSLVRYCCALSVSENHMGPEGAKHFADALVVNRSLTALQYATSSSND